MSTQIRSLRLRWLLGGLIVAGVLSGGVVLLHEIQVARISDRLLREARQLASQADWEAARQKYSDHLHLASADAAAYDECAAVILEASDSAASHAAAYKLLETAISRGHANAAAKAQFARSAIRLGRYDSAAQLLREALRHSDDPELLTLLGECEFNCGSTQAAEEVFCAAIRQEQTHVAAWRGLVQLIEESEGTAAAAGIVDQMRPHCPAGASHAEAWLMVNSGRTADAGPLFYAAARLDPNDPLYTLDLAEWMYRTNPSDSKDVREMAEFCVARLPELPAIESYRCSVLSADAAQRLNRNEDAVRHYEQCLILRPGDEFALCRLAEVHLASGNHRLAAEALRGARSGGRNAALRAILESRIETAEGNAAAALRRLRKTVQAAGDSVAQRQVIRELLMLALETGETEGMDSLAGRLLRIGGDSDEARSLYIRTMAATGRYRKSLRQLPLMTDILRYAPGLIREIDRLAESRGESQDLMSEVEETGDLFSAGGWEESFRAFARLRDSGGESARQYLLTQSVLQPDSGLISAVLDSMIAEGTIRPVAGADDRTGSRRSLTRLHSAEEAAEEDDDFRRKLLSLTYASNSSEDLVSPAVRLISDHKDDAESWHLLAVALRLNGRADEALQYAAAAFAMEQRPAFLLHAAMIRKQLGDSATAERLVDRCLNLWDRTALSAADAAGCRMLSAERRTEDNQT